MQAKPGHFPARAKNVIYLFMAGAPSQFELYDFKPELQKYNNQTVPDSLMAGKRFAFMDTFTKEKPKLLGTRRQFKQYGHSGAWLSELLPHIAGVADDITFVKGVSTENFNHGPAKCFVNTGSTRFGRPSMGAWITYGIGSESTDLPAFRGAAIGPARASRRSGAVGQRIPAFSVPGRAVSLRRRSDSRSLHARQAYPPKPSATRSIRFVT